MSKATNDADDTLLGRVLPQDAEAESTVLGCMLLEPDKTINAVLGELCAEDLFSEPHKDIFKLLLEMHAAGVPIDALTVRHGLEERGLLDKVGGPEALLALAETVPSTANAVYYARIVRKCSLRRAIISSSTKSLCGAYDKAVEPGALLAESVEHMLDVASAVRPGAVAGADRGIAEASLLFDKAGQEDPRRVWSYMPRLDNVTRGLRPGQLVVVAGRPGAGKSTLAINLLRYNTGHDVPCLMFSLEMSRAEIWHNLLLAQSGLTEKMLLTGKDEYWSRLTEAEGEAAGWPLYVDETGGASLEHIASVARQYVENKGVKMIAIDYLQLIQGKRLKQDNREQEVGRVSRGLKALAKNLQVPIVACAQLNREVEKRDDHIPRLSDLRETGQLEMDADMVWMLWRPETFEVRERRGENTTERIEVIIAKHRNGPVGAVLLEFLGSRFTVAEPNAVNKITSPGAPENEPLPYQRKIVARTHLEEPPCPETPSPAPQVEEPASLAETAEPNSAPAPAEESSHAPSADAPEVAAEGLPF